MNRRRDWVAQEVPPEHRDLARQMVSEVRCRMPLVRFALLNQFAGITLIWGLGEQDATKTLAWLFFTCIAFYQITRRIR